MVDPRSVLRDVVRPLLIKNMDRSSFFENPTYRQQFEDFIGEIDSFDNVHYGFIERFNETYGLRRKHFEVFYINIYGSNEFGDTLSNYLNPKFIPSMNEIIERTISKYYRVLEVDTNLEQLTRHVVVDHTKLSLKKPLENNPYLIWLRERYVEIFNINKTESEPLLGLFASNSKNNIDFAGDVRKVYSAVADKTLEQLRSEYETRFKSDYGRKIISVRRRIPFYSSTERLLMASK